MRCLFWFSAALLLAGCGSSTRHDDPFAYDASRPIAVRDAGIAMSNAAVALHVVTYAGASGRVNAFLVVPKSGVAKPAVLFLHGSGGNREDLLLPAVQLANRGGVGLTISQPNDARSFRPLVVNARRALDLLAARDDVDAERLAVTGASGGGFVELAVAALDRRVRTYSKGMGQKLGVLGAFMVGTPLLLLDEPMSGLDPAGRVAVKTLLASLHREGRALFFTSHVLADIDELCSSIAVLERARLRFRGSPQALRSRYAETSLERAFMKCIRDGEPALH